MECKDRGFFSYCKGFIYNTLIKVVWAGDFPDYITDRKTYKIIPIFVVFITILIVFIGAMVLVLALGVFLPMWDLASVAK